MSLCIVFNLTEILFLIVLDEYGVVSYSVYLFAASVWWSLRWEATAAPYTHIEDWLSGANDLFSVAALILSEILGGMIYYRLYLVPLWSLWYAGDAHQAKLENEFCSSDIRVCFQCQYQCSSRHKLHVSYLN